MTTIQLYGDIGFDILASDVADQLKAAGGQDVSVRIFSYGGSAAEGLAIYNILSSYSGKVTTYIDGVAASAAGMPFMAGSERIMPENAMLHMHNAWGSGSGGAEKFRSLADQYDAHTKSMAEIYQKKSGQSVESIMEWMSAGQGVGTWFSAADALTAGFATVVAEAETVMASAAPVLPEGRFKEVPTAILEWAIISKSVNSEHMATSAVAAEAANASQPPSEAPQASVAPAETVASVAPARLVVDPEVAALRRENEIRRCAAQASLPPEAIDALVANGKPFQECAVEIVRAAAARHEAPGMAGNPAQMRVLTDEGDHIKDGIEAAVMAKIFPGDTPDERARPFRGQRMMELTRTFAKSRGINVEGRSNHELISLALHISDDFTNILGNGANKSMMRGWAEETHRWDEFCSRRDLTDFRPTNDVFVEGDLAPVKVDQGTPADATKINTRVEGSEYTMATLVDGKTTWSLSKFTRGLRIAEEVFINDDLSALATVPEKFGRGGRRTQANAIYALITGNAVAGIDGQALFHASHNNTGTGTLGIDGLNAARLKMATQKDPAGNPLELEADFLLAPQSLWGTGKQVLYPGAAYSPAALTGANGPNPFAGSLTDIYQSRLDADSTAKWYLIAGPSKVEGIVYGYLQGEGGPTLTTVTKRNPDCVELLFRLYFGCAIKDYRFIYRSSGVA